jgi:hypothetical protein
MTYIENQQHGMSFSGINPRHYLFTTQLRAVTSVLKHLASILHVVLVQHATARFNEHLHGEGRPQVGFMHVATCAWGICGSGSLILVAATLIRLGLVGHLNKIPRIKPMGVIPAAEY